MNKLKLVKFIVFLLTFLLIVGMFVAIFMLINKKTNISEENINLYEPIGSSIESFKEQNGILSILVKKGGKSDRIVIIDTKSTAKTVINLN